MECFVCKSKENLVSVFPSNKKQLKIWKNNLKLTCDDDDLKFKHICIRHFHHKYHNILLNPNLKRGWYIFPMSEEDSSTDIVVHEELSSDNLNFTQTSETSTNAELFLDQKMTEIAKLKEKITDLEETNKKLMSELYKRDQMDYSVQKIMQETSLTATSKILINILIEKNHTYTEEEKAFCQNFYAKFPGAYNYLNKILGNALPSRRSLTRWQDFKTLNVGMIKEIMIHLKSINSELCEDDKNVCLTLDEMDGKKKRFSIVLHVMSLLDTYTLTRKNLLHVKSFWCL